MLEENSNPERWATDYEQPFNSSSLSDLLSSHPELAIGDTVYVGSAVQPKASEFFSMDDLLESMSNYAADEFGDLAESFPTLTNSEFTQLEEVIAKFLDEHVPVNFWLVRNIRPYTLTEANFDVVALSSPTDKD